jgi:hypothetical protein
MLQLWALCAMLFSFGPSRAGVNPSFGRLARRLCQFPHHQPRMWCRKRGRTRRRGSRTVQDRRLALHPGWLTSRCEYRF